MLLDKRDLAIRMTASGGAVVPRAPTQAVFLNAVHSLFGLVLWESKQLVRHELWMALGTVDQHVKQCLLTMMEWHSIVTNPRLGDTWYGGRRIEEWADPRWVKGLGETWPRYDSEAAWDALFATIDMFSVLARETAEAFGYRYPDDDEIAARSWINARRFAALPDD